MVFERHLGVMNLIKEQSTEITLKESLLELFNKLKAGGEDEDSKEYCNCMSRHKVAATYT